MTDKKPQHTPDLEEHFGVGARYFYPNNDPKEPMKGVVQLWPAWSQKGVPVEIPIKLALAASDLLESAKNALSLIEQKPQSSMTEQAIQWEEELRAAIAKAEGK